MCPFRSRGPQEKRISSAGKTARKGKGRSKSKSPGFAPGLWDGPEGLGGSRGWSRPASHKRTNGEAVPGSRTKFGSRAVRAEAKSCEAPSVLLGDNSAPSRRFQFVQLDWGSRFSGRPEGRCRNIDICSLQTGWPMDQRIIIAQLNIQYLRKQLASEAKEKRRQEVVRLLAEQEAKLAVLVALISTKRG